MNGAVDSVSLFGPLTFAAAFVSPALTLILILFLGFGPRRFRIPAVLPGIPLALTSITLQVFLGTAGILAAFQEIATHRLAGVRNVAGSMAAVTGSFTLSIALGIGCIAALLILQVLRDRRDEQSEWPEPPDKLAPRIAFFFTAFSAFAGMALLWLFERTVDLIMIIVDSKRAAEAREQLGQIAMGSVAAMISHRLVLCEALSIFLFTVFLVAPVSILAGDVPEWIRRQSWTLAVLTALCLIPFAIAYHNEILYMISLTQRN